jgi:hypothetical protein
MQSDLRMDRLMPTVGRPVRVLCRPCSQGNHSRNHGAIGCLTICGRMPYDRVCECEVKRTPLGPPSLEPAGECDRDEEVA